MHVNDAPGAGPLVKAVLAGTQRVALFPPREAGKLAPLNPDSVPDDGPPSPSSIFQVDALGLAEDLGHFGRAADARGWRDEVRAGEALLFLGDHPHQFRNG